MYDILSIVYIQVQHNCVFGHNGTALSLCYCFNFSNNMGSICGQLLLLLSQCGGTATYTHHDTLILHK